MMDEHKLSIPAVLLGVLSMVSGVAAEETSTFEACLLFVGIAFCITLSCGCIGAYAKRNYAI